MLTNSDPVTLPANNDVLLEASHMTNIERFLHLLNQVRALIRRYGTYTILSDTSIFHRASAPRLHSSTAEPSVTEVFLSLGAAQDSINSAQPDGAANDDLRFFGNLWKTTITVLEEILACGSLPQEAFGWGVFALSTGYMHLPSGSLTDQNIFSNHKYRLHTALKMMPSLNGERRSEYIVTGKTSTAALVKTRRDIHTMGHILLSKFRQDQWKSVRWYHAVAVAKRWIQAFGLIPEKKADKTEKTRSRKGKDVSKQDQDTRPVFSFP